jgi:RNA polymerase sigma-70 factor (ECF subfamily)
MSAERANDSHLKSGALAARVARESYGRLLALLTARTRDVAAAEDALADAFAAALTAWPRAGAPNNPEAWLFAAAKRKLIDAARRAQTAAAGEAEVLRNVQEIEAAVSGRDAPDRRLGLMFACAHPDIDAAARTPLMLQTVLGLSAERIAAAFMVAPAVMSQRLVRAKARIADRKIPFAVPPPDEWTSRLEGVLQAIYAGYAEGWADAEGADPHRAALADETIWLAGVLAAQTPNEPEALGLLALLLHLEARRPARVVEGAFVPLEEQDVSLWRVTMQGEAEMLLMRAAALDRPARFQFEAAIQSAHAARRARGQADWAAIVLLYEGLARFSSSPVVALNRAAALARRDGPEAGMSALEAIESAALKSYQPYWALRADLLARLHRGEEARAAYDEAIARERDGAVIRFLSQRRAAV